VGGVNAGVSVRRLPQVRTFSGGLALGRLSRLVSAGGWRSFVLRVYSHKGVVRGTLISVVVQNFSEIRGRTICGRL